MIVDLSVQEVEDNWSVIESALGEFWDATPNFETLDNLKTKLLNQRMFLFAYTAETVKFLFVVEPVFTAKAKIFQVTHTGSFETTVSSPKEAHLAFVSELEDAARVLGFDTVRIYARRATQRLLKDYEVQSIALVKRL